MSFDSQETILCVLSNNSMYAIEIGSDNIFDLDAFCSQYASSEYALFYISPSLIQILPDSGKIHVPEKLLKGAPDFRLQLLPRNGPHFILRIYLRTDKNISLAPWNIIFDQNSNFSLEILNTIFHQSFCVDAEKLEFEFEPNTAKIDLNLPVANQRDVLNTTKVYLNVSMQQKSAETAKRRTKIIAEIIQTEANYVNELGLVNEHFTKEDLKIGDDVYRRTFKSIGEIYPVHERFLKDLAPVGHAIESSVGRVFLKYSSLFRIASPHICNFASSNDEINELTHTSKQFANAVTRILHDFFEGKTIESLLVTPVQRLPRYPLLLRDLLKATSELHWDYMDIKNALNNIQKLVQDMDMKKREQDELNFVADLQAKIGNHYQVMKTGRRGLASIENIKTNKGFKGSVYLFNDALLIWKSSPTEFLEESLTTVKLQKKHGFLIINNTYSIPEGKETDSFCAKFLPARREMIMKLCTYGNALAWTKMEYGTGPELLARPCIVYYDDTLYLFGGRYPDGHSSNDLWMREEGRWKLVETIHTPSPRYGATMSAFDGKLIVFGGQDNDRLFNDLLIYEIQTRTWSIIDAPNKPSPRIGHTSHLVEVSNDSDDEYDDDTMAPAPPNGQNFSNGNPENAATENDADSDIQDVQLWVFGGKTVDQTYSNDLYVFDFSVNMWFRFDTPIDESPSPRAFCVSFLINDEKGGLQFAIQGGRDSTKVFNDLWSFDVNYRTGWNQPETKGILPEARYDHVCGIINNIFYIIGGVDINNESVPPHKLNMNEVPFSWGSIPQCDEPEAFVDGAATVDPNYGVIVFSPSTGYTTIRLCYNAENTLNCEKELSKEKKKMKNAALTCANWSRPFYNKKTNNVTLKVDSDEESDFVLPFIEKSFEHVWAHKNSFILGDEKTNSDDVFITPMSSGIKDSFFQDNPKSNPPSSSSLPTTTNLADDTQMALKNDESSSSSKTFTPVNLAPIPRQRSRKPSDNQNINDLRFYYQQNRRYKRPSSLDLSDSQESFYLGEIHKNSDNNINMNDAKNDSKNENFDSTGSTGIDADLIDFSTTLHSTPLNSQKSNHARTPSVPQNPYALTNNGQNPSNQSQNSSQPQTPNTFKKKFLPVKKFLSNTRNADLANKNGNNVFYGFGTVKPKKSKARDLFESSSKEEVAEDNNNDIKDNIDNDIFINPNSEPLHRSATSLANSYIPNPAKTPSKPFSKVPKPNQKNIKNEQVDIKAKISGNPSKSNMSAYYESSPALGDLIDFNMSSPDKK